jgi:hypothetical protein
LGQRAEAGWDDCEAVIDSYNHPDKIP